jgi:hypothetical protein
MVYVTDPFTSPISTSSSPKPPHNLDSKSLVYAPPTKKIGSKEIYPILAMNLRNQRKKVK